MTNQIDIKEAQKCFHCHRGIMSCGSIVFYELTFQSCVIDLNNIKQMQGMEMAFGAIGSILSPSNSIATRVDIPTKHWICAECAVSATVPALIYLGEE